MNAVEIDSVLIDAIAAFVRERVSGEAAAQAESLVRQYYRWVPAEDLESREPARPRRRGARASGSSRSSGAPARSRSACTTPRASATAGVARTR